MFRTKTDVDKHVQGLLRKVKNDHERTLKCYHIAQLYYKVQDFESARRYVITYLSVRDDSSSAHKLLGNILEAMGQKDKAMSAYKKSLEIEANQSDLVLKMCELLCDKDVTFDPAKAQYWAERASSIFPNGPIVFMLKEKLLSTNKDMNSEDFENLFNAQLKSKPSDVEVRIKLLKLYLESGRCEIALNHVFEIEQKQGHSYQLSWYKCVNTICEKYSKEFPDKCNWEFYMQWLSALDRLCALSTSETLLQPSNLVEATEAIYSLDQVLFKGNKLVNKSPDLFREFFKHLSYQLAFHIAVLLLKRAKKENSLWKEVKKMVCPLFLISSNEPPNVDAAWSMSIKDYHRKLLNLWAHYAQCRIVQAGHVLLSLAKGSKSEKSFMDRVLHFTETNWNQQVFEKIFKTIDNSNSVTSYLVTADIYSEIPHGLPSKSSLMPYLFVPSFELTYAGSLHHLVWLGLQCFSNPCSPLLCKLDPSFRTTSFKSLQYTINNLNNTGVETLNQLDVDSFLYATVFCAGVLLEDQKSNGFYTPTDKPNLLTPDITPLLCTAEQATWWINACSIVKVGLPQTDVKNKVSDMRHCLQRGIEVVRGDGLPLPLIICLARTFALRASESESDEKSRGCEDRALYLWSIAIPQLERLVEKHMVVSSRNSKLFEYIIKELSTNEMSSLLEEGRFFVACHYMKTNQHEKALTAFKPLHSPQAVFNQALIYQKLAEEHIHTFRAEELTSELRCQHTVMATKARDCLYQVRDMIKGDTKHPLQQQFKAKLMEIDDLLCRMEPENGNLIGMPERDGYLSEASLFYGSDGSPAGNVVNGGTHGQSFSRNKPFPASTPNRYYESYRHRSTTAEIVEVLNIHQNTNQLKTQQVLEQSRLVLDRLESVVFEQRNQRSLIEELINKVSKLDIETKNNIADLKKEIKRPDLYNMLDEDDYQEDPLHYPNLPVYSQRGLQGNNSVPYAAPSFFSPRVDQMYQNNLGFYNQAPLPFSDTQQVSDFLRSVPQSSQISAPLTHKMNSSIQSPLVQNLPSHLNLSLANQTVAPTLTSFAGQRLTPQLGQARSGLTPASMSGPNNVVITTSDTLPTSAPPVQPTLSVTIPAQYRLGGAPHNFQITMPPEMKAMTEQVAAAAANTSISESEQELEADIQLPEHDPLSGHHESDVQLPEHDPLPGYQPLIPLPPKVDITTGEENENVLFECRAKLFRFVGKEWKERGIGILKILKDNTTEKCRILMRREQVHKICANHLITSDMVLNPMPCSDKAWIWVANDFADEKLQWEKLSAKFKTVEEAQLFKETFESAKAQSVTPKKTGNRNEAASNSKINQQQPIQTVISNRGSSILTPPKFNLSNLSNVSSNDSNLSITNSSSSVLTTPNGDKSKESFSIQMGSSKTPEKSSTGALSLGGFTFLAPPKLKIEEKKEKETVIEKKTESPFATFTFSTPTTTGTPILKDLLKPASAKSILKEPQFKTPETQKQVMFSSTGSDFGTLAKLNLNSTSNNSTPVKPFQGSGSLLFSGTPTGSFQGASPSSPNVEDDFVPNNEFKPVIPLPELVDVKSGEENEDVLFEERAKLLRFCKDTKEWKERGIGKIKILKDQTTGVIRLLMRRDQVLKVCCNHRLTKDIELKPFPSSDKAATWAVKDYSEEIGKDEVFTIRFKTSEQVQAFKAAFVKAQESLGAEDCSNISNITSKFKASDQPKLTDLFKPPAGSWNCEVCYVRNSADQLLCPACGTSKPGVTPQEPSTFTFGIPPGGTATKVENKLEVKSTPGSWECGSCYIRNDANVTICLACDSPKPGSSAEKPEQSFTFGVSQSAFNAGSSNKENKSIFGGQKCDSTTESGTQYIFGTQNLDIKKEEQKNATSGFSFGTSAGQQDSISSGFTFGTQIAGESTNPGGFTFGTPTNQSTGSKFGFGSSTFSFSMTPTTAISSKSPKTDDSGSEYEEEEDTEDHKIFKPVIPLPDEIEVVTGEEKESVLFCHHSKLFRYDGKNTEWKERGVGDIKILRHNESGKIRLLMRREPVKKLCLNHYITNDIDMIPKDEKSWLWYAIDFSEENASRERFSIRFKTQIIAEEFKKAFDDAKELLKGSSQPSEKKQEDTTDQDSSLIMPGKTTHFEDLEITYEKTVSAEDRAKALALMLPPNFYSYRNAPPCPGCVGCEPNEDEGELNDYKLEPTATLFGNKTSSQNSFFGGTPSVFPLKDAGFTFGKVSKDKSEGNTVDTPTSQNILFDNTSTPLKHPLTVIDKTSDGKTPVATEKSIFGNLSTGVPVKTGGLFSQVGKPTTPGSFFQSMPSFTSVTSTPTNIFGNRSVNPTEAAMPSPTFLNKEAVTFSALASSANSEKSFSGASNFKWEGAGRTVFGTGGTSSAAEVSSTSNLNENRESDDEGGNADESVEEHDPQFAPIISLPAEVVLKTGEEDEDIVFNSRVKLFRYDNNLKEWKERGVGEIKLLKHRLKNTYRLLMRREQVYKIVCNHLVTPDLNMSPLKNSDTSWCWVAMNMAQDYVEPELEKLAVRFKNADLALSFKAQVDAAIAAVTEARINESESSFYSIAQTSRIEEQEVLISVQANTTISTGTDSIVLPDSEICIIPGNNDNNPKIIFKDKNGPVVICLINQSTLLNKNGCEMTLEAVDELTSGMAKISSSMKNSEDLNSFNDVFLDCKKDAAKSH